MPLDIQPGTRAYALSRPTNQTIIAVDVGFASTAKSTGIAIRSDGITTTTRVAFGQVTDLVAIHLKEGDLSLILEAPLTVAFNLQGNPTGRSIEKHEAQTRYWYTGLGASVLLAAVFLLERIRDIYIPEWRTIHLYEGFVTFKNHRTHHDADALQLLATLSGEEPGRILDAQEVMTHETTSFRSPIQFVHLRGLPAIVIPTPTSASL